MTMNFWALYRDGVSAAMAKEPAEISKTMRPIKKTNPFVVIKKKLQESSSLNVPAYPNSDSSSDSTAAMRSRMGHLIALSQLHLVKILFEIGQVASATCLRTSVLSVGRWSGFCRSVVGFTYAFCEIQLY